jgi:uncharacterized protein VirK/YbjX
VPRLALVALADTGRPAETNSPFPPPKPSAPSFWTAATLIQPAEASRRLRKRAKFCLRALGQPQLTRAWLARLVQPDIAPLWALRPRLALKLQRPYLCCAWNGPERFAALLGHYDLLPRIISTGAREEIFRGGLDVIRLINSASGQGLDVRLFYHDKFEKEGELTLAVQHRETGLTLAGITFSLVPNAGRRMAIVGGLQASNDPRMRGLIRDAAKDLHGLRPKALALWCLQQLCVCWAVERIEAIDDAHHVWRHWRKRVVIATCYDEFWSESDGRRLPGGGWELPLGLKHHTRAELKPSRRKTHERRYAMLDALQPKLMAAVAAIAPGPAGLTAPMEFIYSSRDPVSVARAGAATLTSKFLADLGATNHSF